MNKAELRTELERTDVSPESYSLDGGLPNERYVLNHEPGGEWAVYYSERGERTSLRTFESEADACRHFLERILQDSTADRRVISGERAVSRKLHVTMEPDQYAVVQAYVQTGVVLDVTGKVSIQSLDADWYITFDSLEDAENYALSVVTARPDIECGIYDAADNRVKMILNPNRPRFEPRKKSWWRFW